jgi:hypothetical protein
MDVAPRIIPDLAVSSPALANFAEQGGLQSGAIAPVTAGEDFVGVLLAARRPGEQFDSDDLWFLTEVASHASAALANSALYRRQARIAETLQRTLIPPEPAISFLDIATLYAPAPGEARIGGDFFDVFRIDGRRVALVVGDVSGKGVEAAIHTAEAKYMLRAFAHQNPDPLHVVTELNAALFEYLPGESFITLAYFLIDVEAHRMSFVNAGHETSLVLCRNEQMINEIGPNGPILLHDHHFIELMAHFNRERVPERNVHAKGSGAFGVFVTTEDVSRYTKAALFQKGARTDMLARFSTVAGEQGSPDTWRDPRGFALKFYTSEGNYDLVGNNTPVFFIRDTMKFPHFIRSQKRRGGNGLRDNDMQWDFWVNNPESAHQVT